MAINREYIEARLSAYILPRRPQTPAQEAAFECAVDAQADYEDAVGLADLPAGVTSVSNDGIALTFAQGVSGGAYTRETISPAAWAYLRNAGLIAYSLPTARKP